MHAFPRRIPCLWRTVARLPGSLLLWSGHRYTEDASGANQKENSLSQAFWDEASRRDAQPIKGRVDGAAAAVDLFRTLFDYLNLILLRFGRYIACSGWNTSEERGPGSAPWDACAEFLINELSPITRRFRIVSPEASKASKSSYGSAIPALAAFWSSGSPSFPHGSSALSRYRLHDSPMSHMHQCNG